MPTRPAAVPAPGGHRLVVLPFANVSPEPGDEYFVDGMTDELISAVSRISGLKVIARTSAMRYKGASKSVAEIGRELNVRTVVEGSVRKAGRSLRIAVRLIDATNEEPIWSQEFDRELADVFAIQREIAQRIARSLKVRLRAAESRRLETPATGEVDAYAHYLRGRFYWNQRTSESLEKAVRFFEEALEKDPRFALAHTGLADAHATLALLELVPPSDAFPRARAAAERALALDPALAEAHASLGLVRFQYDRDWDGAERSLRQAIELSPNYAPGHQFYADYLKAMGRFDEALEQMHRAGELDPLSLAIQTGIGHVLYLSRQYDRAIAQYRQATVLDPTFVQAHLWFGRPYLETGRFAEAIQELTKAVELSGGSTISLAVLGHAYASAGNAEKAREILDQLLARSRERYLPSYWIALLYTGLGEVDTALDWLERAFEERSSWLVWINVEPRFDRLRAAPRFGDLLRRMGFPPAPTGGAPTVDARTREWLATVAELVPAHFRVVGEYTRFDPTSRHRLKDLRQRLVARLEGESPRLENFLLWAPPGGGKSFFVQEVARSLVDRVRFLEINLAALDEREFRRHLEEATAAGAPTLAFVDEVDAHPGEPWPYEALLPHLEPRGARSAPLAVVLAGSTGATLDDLRAAIARRPKGIDLLSRVPAENGYSIPPMVPGDRVLVAASHIASAAGRAGRRVDEVERLALLFVVATPSLGNARQLREFVTRAVERIPRGEERLRFDHLFDPGDPHNKEFWLSARTTAPSLAGEFVRLAPGPREP